MKPIIGLNLKNNSTTHKTVVQKKLQKTFSIISDLRVRIIAEMTQKYG